MRKLRRRLRVKPERQNIWLLRKGMLNHLELHEKILIGVATKGVVKLFNAVNKVQHASGGVECFKVKRSEVKKHSSRSLGKHLEQTPRFCIVYTISYSLCICFILRVLRHSPLDEHISKFACLDLTSMEKLTEQIIFY